VRITARHSERRASSVTRPSAAPRTITMGPRYPEAGVARRRFRPCQGRAWLVNPVSPDRPDLRPRPGGPQPTLGIGIGGEGGRGSGGSGRGGTGGMRLRRGGGGGGGAGRGGTAFGGAGNVAAAALTGAGTGCGLPGGPKS
jgi:translation initiation factor IF-2